MIGAAIESSAIWAAQTYEAYYGFKRSPFAPDADPLFLFLGESHKQALDRLVHVISTQAGCALLTGGAGTGKTTLLGALAGSLDPRTFTSLVLDSRLPLETMVRAILVDFGIMSDGDVTREAATRDGLVNALRKFLASLASIGGHGVIILDQAEHVSDDVLEQLLPLTSELAAGQPRLQIVLVGRPEVARRLEAPALRAFSMGISSHVTLTPLDRRDTEAYVNHRLAVGKSQTPPRVAASAMTALFQYSGGVPRTINALCDRALMRCARDRTLDVTRDAITWAGRDLGLVADEASQAAARGRGGRWLSRLAGAVTLVALGGLALYWAGWFDSALPPLPPGPPSPVTVGAAAARPLPPILRPVPAAETVPRSPAF